MRPSVRAGVGPQRTGSRISRSSARRRRRSPRGVRSARWCGSSRPSGTASSRSTSGASQRPRASSRSRRGARARPRPPASPPPRQRSISRGEALFLEASALDAGDEASRRQAEALYRQALDRRSLPGRGADQPGQPALRAKAGCPRRWRSTSRPASLAPDYFEAHYNLRQRAARRRALRARPPRRTRRALAVDHDPRRRAFLSGGDVREAWKLEPTRGRTGRHIGRLRPTAHGRNWRRSLPRTLEVRSCEVQRQC